MSCENRTYRADRLRHVEECTLPYCIIEPLPYLQETQYGTLGNHMCGVSETKAHFANQCRQLAVSSQHP